jgi:hypothetical protein
MLSPLAAVLALAAVPPDLRVFACDLDGFLAAVPEARVTISFDGGSRRAEFSAVSVHGVTFLGPGAPLLVVRAASTLSPDAFFEDVPIVRDLDGRPKDSETRPVPALQSRLLATSGESVLSPGGSFLGPGPDRAIEEDDLTLSFCPPVRAFGIDLLTQSRDGQSNVTVRVEDSNGRVLHEGGVPIGASPGYSGGSDFWGIVCGDADIARIEFDESDSNDRFPDCNIGFDSLRIVPQPCPADLDGSTRVDAADSAVFLRRYQEASKEADLTLDGRVDLHDLAAFIAAFGADSQP